jgi:hypothetical protein
VTNCTFRGNAASTDGGGFQSNQGTQRLTDVTVEGNTANSRGGGLHLVQGRPVLTRVHAVNNQCSNIMGGISWYAAGDANAWLDLRDCTVTGNGASVAYGGIGTTESSPASTTLSIGGTTACGNLPRPNVFGRYQNLGGNQICDCVGDLSLDGVVNGADLGLLLSAWGPCVGACPADLDGSGMVDGFDLSLLLTGWVQCGP